MKHTPQKQQQFRAEVAKQFDQLTEVICEYDPGAFVEQVSAIQRIGYQVIARAAQQEATR